MPGTPPPSLLRIADRVDARLADLLAVERTRWSSLDPDLAHPIDEIGRLVLSRRQAAPAGVLPLGLRRGRRRPRRPDRLDAGAAFELLHAFALVPRRRDGRCGRPVAASRPRTRSPRPTTPEQGWAGRVAPIRRGRRDPRRRPGLRLRRPADGSAPVEADPHLERAADRAQHRPVPRHPRHGPARTRPREGPSASAATSRASTRSSGRCTSVRCWPADVPTCCSRR